MSPPLCADLISVYDRATAGSTKIMTQTHDLLHDRRYRLNAAIRLVMRGFGSSDAEVKPSPAT